MPRLHRILNIPEYFLNISEYAKTCVNVPKPLNVAKFPILNPCILEYVVTYFNVYTKLEVIV